MGKSSEILAVSSIFSFWTFTRRRCVARQLTSFTMHYERADKDWHRYGRWLDLFPHNEVMWKKQKYNPNFYGYILKNFGLKNWILKIFDVTYKKQKFI